MKSKPDNSTIAGGLLFAIFLWGAGNAGTKYVVQSWPPIFVGSTRFLAAGLTLFALLRWTRLFGMPRSLSPELSRRLWWRCGLSLALYIMAFNWAFRFTSASHVVLYLGASPVWALLWETPPDRSWKTVQRYGAAALALVGVLVLVWPTLQNGSMRLMGEILGFSCSILWTQFGRQCKAMGTELSGPEITAYSFWRAGLLLAPFAAFEFALRPVPLRTDLVLVHLFCILGGGVVAFGIWSTALRHWPTGKVYLFNNLIPLSTMAWANICLGEPITPTFWIAMLLIASGVVLGQTNWQRILGARWLPAE